MSQRVPIKNTMGALKSLTKRFVDGMERILQDPRFQWDDEYYIWSAFVANISGAVEHAKESLEFWPEEKEDLN